MVDDIVECGVCGKMVELPGVVFVYGAGPVPEAMKRVDELIEEEGLGDFICEKCQKEKSIHKE